MFKKEYTTEQMAELSSNPSVVSCTSKYIMFTDDFKIKVIELDKMWLYYKRIFKDFWFPTYIVDSKIPIQSLKNWRRKFKENGIIWLISAKRWRKKKEKIDISKMNKDEYIEYLEAKTRYLEEIHKKAYGHYP